MQITMNTVVTMTYEIKDTDGNILESGSERVSYLHGGYDNIFPKIEEAMHGKKIGDTLELGLEPSDAFGEYDAELVQIEPKSAFPKAELKVGMQFEGDDNSGEIIVYTVTDITEDKVVVDGNHPWAGEKIFFKAEIKDIRLANEKEIKHKHAHENGEHRH